MLPSTLVRRASGWYHWPRLTWVGWSTQYFCRSLDDLLLLGRIGLLGELVAQLLDRRVARPAEHGLVARGVEEAGHHRIEDVGRHPRGEEGVPAALVRRVLLGAAGDQRLPVHRLHVDLEAGRAPAAPWRPGRGWSAPAGRSTASARSACRRSPLPSGAAWPWRRCRSARRPCRRRWRAACRRRTAPCRPCTTADRRSWP